MNQNSFRTPLPDGGYINHYPEHNVYCNKQGIVHREDGPAIEWKDGNKEWYHCGERHRTDGPAIIYSDAAIWYCHNKRHRLDGPAVVYAGGFVEYYIDGDCYSEVEYWKLIRLKAFW